MSVALSRQSRCLSYNDLKKRRCLRQSKSREKFKEQSRASTAVQTQKKNNKYRNYQSLEQSPESKDKQKNLLKPVKNSLGCSDIIEPKSQILYSANYFTDRQNQKGIETQNLRLIRKKIFIQMAQFDTKSILKSLIEQKKKSDRILKFSELRDELKESKSKQKNKSLGKPSLDTDRTPKKSKISLKFKEDKVRIKKFQVISETSRLFINSKSKRKLKQLVKNQCKEKDRNSRSAAKLKSQNNTQKRGKRQNEQQLLEIINDQQKYQQKTSNNILDLLEIQNSQLEQKFSKQSNKNKKTKLLKKFNKMFPEGFLKL